MFAPTIVPTADAALATSLHLAIDNKTKPRGSLGLLEGLAARIGLIQKSCAPQLIEPVILIFAGDHGVTAENISAFPQSVTWQMMENFLQGGAAINVFARQNGCALKIIDAGVNHEFGTRPGLVDRKVAPGTRNFVREPAMSAAECELALQHGASLVDELNGNVVGFGEMGIGNTTSAAALMHVLTGLAAAQCVGTGTGLDADGVQRKQQAIEAAHRLHAEVTEPLAVLATYGGFEIAMMVGAMLRAAERRMVLLIDGFIVSAALLVAARMQPAILDYCVFSHCSQEQGHRLLLEYLHARPLLHLDLRLGEGSGCALAMPLLHSAVNFLTQMATFSSAQVSGKLVDSPAQ
ncbi:nicotinate-nucleotide--dimethylbenzimidazole phosphoribosyltransferase [Herbaspirillum sp. RTI4]|uniref:nicotinate-nucleotide--dimethylbenzimidazole phosphoribosyltransferase n=1 Tax=Herbaspirillum sp. RTI4 TaxID=3048640 RepID=UPI002AB598F4|nr:nicotinate-nucleotide--dimethylbenzimidazole phosphoribosyltransferase [Herbaspirillum sp. RTI4]MDY7579554.1 nicotinate-nucleotide--dimethylbenzimidazole phosphoribosyltransferase [Herbaspirillum sp. RTI4]MEA9981817.1 nicotinate-nucleotide--dimethylbenzimidazole phosphoribosyltransferase [Herbaspirillum sp. RTI4]